MREKGQNKFRSSSRGSEGFRDQRTKKYQPNNFRKFTRDKDGITDSVDMRLSKPRRW